MESRFADIIWEYEPITSGELVKLCAEKLDWKKSTTYTMLRRLCQRGIFVNDNKTVRRLMRKSQYRAAQAINFIDEYFNGSLVDFFSALADNKKIQPREADDIIKLLESHKA